MPELSISHINQISSDIRRQEISFSHLLEDLIDHVCCDVEYEMQNGLDFSEAYGRVKQRMGTRRLKEIQEETLYAVDTKYRNMKNMMKISGVAGTVLLGFAAIFKIGHFPGAGIMLTLGAFLLAFFFLPSALVVLWKETHNNNRLLVFISAFFAGIFFILGTLFKIQHWPGAGIILSLAALSGILFFIPALLLNRITDKENKTRGPVYVVGAAGIIFYMAGMLFKIQHWPLAGYLMVTGLIMLCIIAFPWYTWLKWRHEAYISSRFFFILIGTIAIIIPGALLNLNLQNTYEDGYYSNQEQQQALYSYMYKTNLSFIEQYRDSSAYRQMGLLHEKTTGLLDLIDNIQIKMIAESEGKTGIPASDPAQMIKTDQGPGINYKTLSTPFHPAPVRDFLLPGTASREELNKALSEYSFYISGLYSDKDRKEYTDLLKPSVFLPDKITDGREISLMAGLHALELFKNSILTVESYSLLSVAGK